MSVLSIDAGEAVKALAQQRKLSDAVQRAARADHKGALRAEDVQRITEAQAEIARATAANDAGALDDLWKPLGELCDLSVAPPPRDWLLRRPDPDTSGLTSVGVYPMSKVGMLIAQGGVGKTLANIELAIAVATGRRWLDLYDVERTGRVLLALAEEDAEEVHRRFYDVSQAMRLTAEQVRLVREMVVVLPLAGHHVALLAGEAGDTRRTAFYEQLVGKLRASEWRLIALDPLSRFAAGDTEKDNASATRFIECAESLAQVPGRPAVIVAHHTNKVSRSQGGKPSSSDSRGASALTDGARWVARLEHEGDDGALFKVTKSNYAPHGPEAHLVRDRNGGRLRVMTSDEWREASAKRGDKGNGVDADAQIVRAVLAFIAANPGKSKDVIAKGVRGRAANVRATVDTLGAAGVIRKTSDGWHMVEGGDQ